jgi:hypothetical protein
MGTILTQRRREIGRTERNGRTIVKFLAVQSLIELERQENKKAVGWEDVSV